jgi:electron transport complex protein RnfC
MDCIECGCCAYVCPSHLPLVQYYQASKTNIWKIERQHLKSEKARNRFESREKRLDKEKLEHEIEQISATDKEQIKKEIAAAVKRVKEKRKSEEMPSSDENDNTND